MFARTATLLTVMILAVPVAALAHAGRVPHIHPHEAPLVVVLVLAGAVALTRVLARRRV